MIKINKANVPPEYTEWLREYTRSHKRSPKYNDIPQYYKENLKNNLIQEQKGLCCYCCGSIGNNESHIEHFYPQELCKIENIRLQTDYRNLFISCNGFSCGFIVNGQIETCGHRKKNEYNENLISPIDEFCESYFSYTSDGRIMPKDDNQKAKTTISILGLDDYALNQARKSALEAIDYFEESYDKEAARFLSRNEDEQGRLMPYCNIIRYFTSE